LPTTLGTQPSLNITGHLMRDDKRLLRKIKRDVKRAGNRQRRRFLKDVTANPDEFDFQQNRSDVMNEKPGKKNTE